MRAFKKGYDYYRLKKDCLGLKAGAIFYHDKTDKVHGSPAQGCLKLSWDADGNYSFGTCGGTYVLHLSATKDTDFLEFIDISKKEHLVTYLKDKMIAKFNMNFEHIQSIKASKDNAKHPKITSYCEGQLSAYRDILNLIENITENMT